MVVHWSYSFDYAASFLALLILGWYLIEKRIPLKTHRVFLAFVMLCFASSGMEVAAGQLAMLLNDTSGAFYWCVRTAQSLAIGLVPSVFTYYTLLLCNIKLSDYKPFMIVYLVCTVTQIFMIVTNPFTHWLYDVVDAVPVYKSGLIIIGVIIVILTAGCIQLMARNSDTLSLSKRCMLILNVLWTVTAAWIQYKSQILIVNFILSSICLTLYYYLQNPNTVTDPVTRQFNRQFMGEYVRHRYMDKKPFGVIVVAMDDYKFINKTYGVENGDNLLLQVGTYLEDAGSKNDVVFRFGSDQFCIIMDKHRNRMNKLALEIQRRFKHPWFCDVTSGIMMSASICCMECPRDAADYGSLIEVIDYSMTMAKKLNKGMISNAVDLSLDKIQRDKAIEKAVKQALDRDEMMVYYQPIYSVNKGCYNSAEALVRMKDDELGWVSPEDFIPIAEKNGLIIEMGEVILDKVCRFIHDFNLAETTVEYIEVNISPVQLLQANFADRVMEIMAKYDVKPEQINMEITETATMGSSDVVAENISRLIEFGIKFSLDDYGSGYANIEYINRMPFSIIKLDKYIIWDAFKNSKAGITLEYTIGMLNALQLHIVAEGIETAEMRDHLINIGCHYMQGWYYSKAVEDVKFMQLINAQE